MTPSNLRRSLPRSHSISQLRLIAKNALRGGNLPFAHKVYPLMGGAVSRTGERIAVHSQERVYIFDRQKEEPTIVEPEGKIALVRFDPTGQNLAVITEQLEFLDISAHPPQRRTFKGGAPRVIDDLDFSADGRFVVCLCPREVELFDARNLSSLGLLTIRSDHRQPRISPDGTWATMLPQHPRSGVFVISWTMAGTKPQNIDNRTCWTREQSVVA